MLESSRFCQRGQHQRAAAVRRVRSDRGPRAGQRYIGVTWKPVRPVLVLGDHTGTDETGHQHPGRAVATSPRHGANGASQPKGTRRNATNGAMGERGGSLTSFIVPSESRRTELREPGSREGSCRMRKLWARDRAETQCSSALCTKRPQRAAAALSPSDEPYALIGLVRVCGGAGG